MQVSERLQQLKPSATIAMTEKARELKTQGKDIISLSIGEPDFETPDFIKEAAIQAIHDNYNHYTPVPGFADLRETICEKFKRDNGIDYTPNQIVVSTGAKNTIYNIIQSLVNPGDEVIIPAPYWVSYADITELAGGVPVVLKAGIEDDYKVSAEKLKAAIGPKTKAVLYSSPCNPSGSVLSKEDLAAWVEVLKEHPNVTIISDEIYEHIHYADKPVSIASFPEVYNQTVTVNGLAKGFAMTGWRIGFMGGPEWIAKACGKLQGQVTSGTNAIAQRAAITALKADPKDMKYMLDAFAKRRDLVIGLASNIPLFKVNQPKGAFYLFPDVSACFGKSFKGKTINDSNDLAMYLLEEAGVATVSGAAFGAENCLRISYATGEDQLKEAVFKHFKKLASGFDPLFKVNQPKGAFYLFPDVSACFGKNFKGKTINDADDLAMYLLEEAGIATVSGGAFGAENCLRISYATGEDQLKEAFRRITEALA
ncbi:unnamed protein product [Cyprideis torosa]|uniref:Aminotransferase class I/classII large domain-containing protein n=1 Tax=Cyprideis torosa TaxID=163714 RepID=A0A7R8ZLS8_9CRUS|nr:unnamed protein product [Cyprideis torosa]CAG0892528.1 unnamed protein product [Cyprideis torosa]